ncbi:MAG TPA: YidB family protein [Oleiagrimonas sp.]|nr:YidB family protein [Oleiagrimonas sp.]
MSILGNVMGGLTSGQGGGMMALAGKILQRVGGIKGLMNLLSSHGLGQQVSSWIGTGENQSVSGAQLGQALQQGGLGDLVGKAAQEMGMDVGQVHEQLAQVLPQVVDHLSPDGRTPSDDGGDMDLSSLSGLAGKLFG